MDRAPDYESGGWEFESLRVRQDFFKPSTGNGSMRRLTPVPGYPNRITVTGAPVAMDPFMIRRLTIDIPAGLPPIAIAASPIPMAGLPDINALRRRRNDFDP